MNNPTQNTSLTMPATSRPRRSRFFLFLFALCAVGAGIFLSLGHLGGAFTDVAALDPAGRHTARQPGPVLLAVQEGQRVARGNPLFSIRGAEALTRLADEEARLAVLETHLPVEYVRPAAARGIAGASPDGSGNTDLTDISDTRLRELFDAENAARKAVSEATALEARAAVDMRAALGGQRNATRLSEARQRHEEAKNTAEAQRAALEEASTVRAAVERERARITAMQAASGVKNMPAGPRIREYERQLALVLAAREQKDAAVIAAPAEGIVSDISVKDGQWVEPGQPVLTFSPINGYTLVLLARVARLGNEDSIRPEAPVSVTIPAIAAAPFAGRINNVSVTPPVMLDGGPPSAVPSQRQLLAEDSRSLLWKLLDTVYVVIHVPVSGAHSPVPAGAVIEVRSGG